MTNSISNIHSYLSFFFVTLFKKLYLYITHLHFVFIAINKHFFCLSSSCITTVKQSLGLEFRMTLLQALSCFVNSRVTSMIDATSQNLYRKQFEFFISLLQLVTMQCCHPLHLLIDYLAEVHLVFHLLFVSEMVFDTKKS